MREKRSVWFWYLLSIFFFIFLGVKVEPLKTINEMYSAPAFLVVLVFFISAAIGVVVGLRKGKIVRREVMLQKTDDISSESMVR